MFRQSLWKVPLLSIFCCCYWRFCFFIWEREKKKSWGTSRFPTEQGARCRARSRDPESWPELRNGQGSHPSALRVCFKQVHEQSVERRQHLPKAVWKRCPFLKAHLTEKSHCFPFFAKGAVAPMRSSSSNYLYRSQCLGSAWRSGWPQRGTHPRTVLCFSIHLLRPSRGSQLVGVIAAQ